MCGLLMAAAAMALLAGCQSSTKSDNEFHSNLNEKFWYEEHEARIARNVVDHQAVMGAQADPTLYACHFDGTALNSLGKAKLDAMLVDGAVSKIYIDSGKSNADAHRASVNAYLAAANKADGSVAVEAGSAPAALHPAAPSIVRMEKTENPGKTGNNNESSATNAGSGMASH
jgi:hypothetical protein